MIKYLYIIFLQPDLAKTSRDNRHFFSGNKKSVKNPALNPLDLCDKRDYLLQNNCAVVRKKTSVVQFLYRGARTR